MSVAGTVAAFDEHRGLGTVRSDDGRELPFHCTSIADGSRTVRVGSRVRFSVVAGHRGRWEAVDLDTRDDPLTAGAGG
jgi:cold shock CspA family protein